MADSIETHRAYLRDSGEMQRRERGRIANELDALLREVLLARLLSVISQDEIASLVDQIVSRDITPQQAVDALVVANSSAR